MKAVQTDLFESAQIDLEIKMLLFANPSIGMKVSKSIICSLNLNTIEQKTTLCSWLKEYLDVFKKKAKDITDPTQHLDLFEQLNKHVEQWEEEFGKVSLSDIQLLTDSTDIKLADLGWKLGKITPASLARLLDDYMVGQEEYKQSLGLTVYTHMLRMLRPKLNIPKLNQLVYGPSGVGKTSGIKILGEKLGIVTGTVNFERVQTEGIQGPKLTDPLTRGLGDKKDDMILIIDEVDKNSDEEIRHELLSILDDKNVITFPTTFGAYREYREIPSKNITCILCGKFDSLKEVVRKRIDTHRIGFSSEKARDYSDDELYAQVNMNDLKKVLGSEELCGRIGNFVGVRQMKSNDLVTIMLNKKDSIFNRYQAFFSANHTKLELTTDGAKEIADIAISKYQDLGVRGLEIVIRQLLMKAMLHVEDFQGKSILIDKGYVHAQFNDTTNS